MGDWGQWPPVEEGSISQNFSLFDREPSLVIFSIIYGLYDMGLKKVDY